MPIPVPSCSHHRSPCQELPNWFTLCHEKPKAHAKLCVRTSFLRTMRDCREGWQQALQWMKYVVFWRFYALLGLHYNVLGERLKNLSLKCSLPGTAGYIPTISNNVENGDEFLPKVQPSRTFAIQLFLIIRMCSLLAPWMCPTSKAR